MLIVDFCECVSDFLEAYGYTPEYAMKGSKYDGMGCPRTRNFEEAAEELKRREALVGVPDSGFAVATMPFNILAIDFGGVEARSTTI